VGNELTKFEYAKLDGKTADFLRSKERNMREIVGKAYTELGRELYEAQQALSKNGYGCFREWCEYIGINKMKSTRLIQRYKLIINNPDKTELIERLPVSLAYEISKPSNESRREETEAKNDVLNGKITTLKDFKERVEVLKVSEINVTRSRLKEYKRRVRNGQEGTKNRLLKDSNYCYICENDCTPILQIHHVKPVEIGGDNSKCNVVLLCPNCHAIVHVYLTDKLDKKYGLETAVEWVNSNMSDKGIRRLKELWNSMHSEDVSVL